MILQPEPHYISGEPGQCIRLPALPSGRTGLGLRIVNYSPYDPGACTSLQGWGSRRQESNLVSARVHQHLPPR